MDDLNLSHHISQQFAAELEDVRSRVLTMGGMVEDQLRGAVEAMVECDSELAGEIADNDYLINRQEVEIDEECTQILARRQPAASDLRLVMAVIKTITDLERIGDEAERVARMAQHMASDNIADSLRMEIGHMGELVQSMLHDVLDAFARTDVNDAANVVGRDRKVDNKFDSLTRQLITYMAENSRNIQSALNVLWAARSLERIGDRCKNIAEYVIYLVGGKDIRHTKLSRKLVQNKGQDSESDEAE